MHSSIIGKIEKARLYAQEKDRITFSELNVSFRGDHDSYQTGFKEGGWYCTCHYFSVHGLCSHTMSLQKILGSILPEDSDILCGVEA